MRLADAPVGRCAYLVSQYPALSHVFIETEVAALRRLGWSVDTFSVRPTLLLQHVESRETAALQAGGARAMASAVVRTEPRALLAGLRQALRLGARRSLKRRVWQLFYLAEAAVLHRLMRARGLVHVHVHFGNNSADIARLTCAIGDAIDGPGSWTWSLTVHGPTELDHAVDYDLARKVLSATFVACISDFCRSQVMRLIAPQHWGRLHVVPMGVRSDVPSSAFESGGPTDTSGDALRVLFVGRLVPEKGPHILLDAADALGRSWLAAQKRRSLEVVLVGDGPLRASLEERATMAVPGVAVRLLGGLAHEELVPWYSWAEVFCLPSFAEGLPVVLMEALAHRLPVVTTAVAGIPELIINQQTGLLVAPGRADLIAEALEFLEANPVMRRRLGDAGHVAVRFRHDVDTNGILLARLLARSTPEGDRCPSPETHAAERVPPRAGDADRMPWGSRRS